MNPQLSLFGDTSHQSTATHAVLVRSHLRRVKGEPIQRPDPSDYVEQARQEDKRRAESRDTGLLAPHNGQATSQAAAESLTTEHLQNQERRVLDALRTAGQQGLTREQLADITGIRLTDICRVCNGLAALTEGAQRAGRVARVTDGPDTRKSRAGRAQKIVRGIV